jgi:hypothetical protein
VVARTSWSEFNNYKGKATKILLHPKNALLNVALGIHRPCIAVQQATDKEVPIRLLEITQRSHPEDGCVL